MRGGLSKQSFGGHAPAVGRHVFLAHNASVIGQVSIGAHSSVWYQAVVRGTSRFLPRALALFVCKPRLCGRTRVVTIHDGRSRSSLVFGSGLCVTGDRNPISIGSNVHLQDGVVTGASGANTVPTVVGDDVVVGPNAVLQACTLRGRNVIGAGAQVLDGAVVESGSIVAPGAVVEAGKVVPAGQVYDMFDMFV